VRNLPKTTWKQRERFYTDTIQLVNPGFLTHSVLFDSISVSFRSLNVGDYFLLRNRCGQGKRRTWRDFRAYTLFPSIATDTIGTEVDIQRWVLATSVWMLNGYNLLGQTNVVPHLHDVFRQLHPSMVSSLFNVVQGLTNRANRAATLAAEAFCFEPVSRTMWKQLGQGRILPCDEFTGVPGSASMGANKVQTMWTWFHQYEDQKIRDAVEWANVKFSVSPHAPKGMKSLDARDHGARLSEVEERQKILDRFYYIMMGVISPESDEKDREIIRQATSAEELETEMRRWIVGEQDEHDRVVTNYKARLVAYHEREKEAQRLRIEEARKVSESIGESTEPMRIMAFTLDQMQEILGEQRRTTLVVDAPRNYAYEKYIGKTSDKWMFEGRLKVGADGRIERLAGQDMTEKLQDRKATLHLGEDTTDG